MVNRIEWTRRQLNDVEQMLKSQADPSADKQSDEKKKANADLLKSVQDMGKKLQDVEFKLVSPSEVNSDDKYYVEPYRVYLNLIWLNAEVGTGGGDVAGGADFAPTDSALTLLDMIEKDLTSAKSDYANLFEKELPAFNRSLAEHGITPAVAVQPAGGDAGEVAPD